jgi:hypothetical protein
VAGSAGDAHPEACNIAFLLLGEMTDTVGVHLKPQFGMLAGLFRARLSDGNANVQSASVRAPGLLMSYLADEEEINTFAPLIVPLLNIAKACRACNNKQMVSTFLDVLYDLSFSPSQVMAKHMALIVRFTQMCMADSNLEMAVRDSAMLVVVTIAESKSKLQGRDAALDIQPHQELGLVGGWHTVQIESHVEGGL